MTCLQSHLSLLEAGVGKYGSSTLFKIPRGAPDQGWKDITFAQFQSDVETYARRWTHELSESGWAKQSVIGIW
jgi:hypothetical protein